VLEGRFKTRSRASNGAEPVLVKDDQLGKLLRSGSSKLYEFGEGQLLRSFGKPLATVQREVRRCKQAQAEGLPAVEIVQGPVRLEDSSFGFVFLSHGGTLASLRLKSQRSAAPQIQHGCAQLLAEIHRTPAWAALPSQRERLFQRISQAARLNLRLRQQALRWLEDLPDDSKVCHGNFQASEVLLSGQQRMLATGWRNAARGNPIADLAHAVLLLTLPVGKDGWLRGLLTQWSQKAAARRLVDAYRESADGDLSQLPLWIKVCAAMRSSESRRSNRDVEQLAGLLRR